MARVRELPQYYWVSQYQTITSKCITWCVTEQKSYAVVHHLDVADVLCKELTLFLNVGRAACVGETNAKTARATKDTFMVLGGGNLGCLKFQQC